IVTVSRPGGGAGQPTGTRPTSGITWLPCTSESIASDGIRSRVARTLRGAGSGVEGAPNPVPGAVAEGVALAAGASSTPVAAGVTSPAGVLAGASLTLDPPQATRSSAASTHNSQLPRLMSSGYDGRQPRPTHRRSPPAFARRSVLPR